MNKAIGFAILAESCGKKLLYAARMFGEAHPLIGASEILGAKDEFDLLVAQLKETLEHSGNSVGKKQVKVEGKESVAASTVTPVEK